MAGKTKKAASSKAKNSGLVSQTDPAAPLDARAFLAALAPVRRALEDDLLARARSSEGVLEALRARHDAERSAKRTGDDFDSFQRHFVEQVAAAWILGVVFVRTLEDRGLLDRHRIAGPGADDSLNTFRQLAPSLTERDYLRQVFRELARFPVGASLFDPAHNPVFLLGPSSEASKKLLDVFRGPDPAAPAFRFGAPDTRFLGDLYQDLNEHVRERYALLQTPDFVESLILDRTLEPAIQRFGLDETTLLDPTCGSGHFLLSAFQRLVDHRRRKEPSRSPAELAQRALDAIAGTDINPYAVAIARFRLTLAFLDVAGFAKLATAPALPMHVAVADSLLHAPRAKAQQEIGYQNAELADAYFRGPLSLDEPEAAIAILGRGYAAVVGNPPYITVKDAVLREEYRAIYTSAAGKYSLSAPFTECFFGLARAGGFVGLINANAFMKREFGKRLIEDVLPKWNLTMVANTAGIEIPGHGTPTVVLFGTNEMPASSAAIGILARSGAPPVQDGPSNGPIWSNILEHLEDVGFENEYVSVATIARETLAKHPWSLSGGGAGELKELLEERAEKRLGDVAESIGVGGMSNADDVYLGTEGSWLRLGVPKDWVRPLVVGEEIRDWTHHTEIRVFCPYDDKLKLRQPVGRALVALWPYRTALWGRAVFGGGTYRSAGRTWWEWHQLTVDRYRTPLTITFAEVATHNHFVLDRGGKVFKQTAPIIKLPESATEDDHLALLAYLNSSVACFWMKQVAQSKSNHSEERPEKFEAGSNRFQFAATAISKIPIPLEAERSSLVAFAREFERRERVAHELSAPVFALGLDDDSGDLEVAIALAERRHAEQTESLVALQEELDWFVYARLGLANAECDGTDRSTSRLEKTRRPFCAESPPESFATEDSLRWWARKRAIRLSPLLGLVENAEFKRRWVGAGRGSFAHGARTYLEELRDAVLDAVTARVERSLSASSLTVSPRRVVPDAVDVGRTRETIAVLVVGGDPIEIVSARIASESVPFLAALRYTDAGLEKHAAWQHTWSLQRREDAGESVGAIPVPPKYDAKDFRDARFFSLRGKLDVPKERFISYPGCESDEDREPVYGWAGWDHAQRAQALVALYQDRKTREGWPKERLVPMLAGLLELLPWLLQWHDEPSAELDGERIGQSYQGFLDAECREIGVTRQELSEWRPVGRGARAATAKTPKSKTPKTPKTRGATDVGDESR